ncbi:hypothetical protein BJ875DRAFT_509106 [Amylocarpus encephaloides]|uniref:Late sexual development protein n=1 Tax=Amylocarpus encephaloides TaxID=45428 RepID=A0A9P8C5X3_9HELO|nr:hypothetical protein BJ875DRAFT_509106 [Amylocarpus encephaloides]
MIVSLSSVSLIGLICLSAIVSAAPFAVDSSNNFPNPSPDQIKIIEAVAHGSLPNGKPPAKVENNTLTSLRFIALNEFFEVAFYTSLIANVTQNVTGYDIKEPEAKKSLLATLTAIQAQEELHAINANNALKNFKVDPIQPCLYQFPSTSVQDAITLATTFNDVVLGTLPDIQQLLGAAGDVGLIPGVGSVIGQEDPQSALPFLTRATRDIAFSALNQAFVVKGSCPNSNTIALKIFEHLTVDAFGAKALALHPSPQNLQFSFQLPAGGAKPNWSGLSLAFVNQQNVPVKAQLSCVLVKGNTVHFEAHFPFNGTTFGSGLTFAMLVSADADFSTVPSLVQGPVVFGPALIEVN